MGGGGAGPWEPSRWLSPHLFFPPVSHFPEHLHYHPDDSVLWKKVSDQLIFLDAWRMPSNHSRTSETTWALLC